MAPSFVQPASYINASLIIIALGAACFASLALPSVPYFLVLVLIFAAVSMRHSGEAIIDTYAPRRF